MHLIGFTGNLYEQKLGVDFVKKIRDTKPFGNVQELTAQIRADVIEAKRVLGA